MSYEPGPIHMRAENILHNEQTIHINHCKHKECDCKDYLTALKEHAALVRQAQQENMQLLLEIKRTLESAQKNTQNEHEAKSASANAASESASAEGENPLKPI